MSIMDKNIEKAKNHINPFLHPYGTPHDAVPFDRIELADYEEAMMEGIRRDNESIDRIVNNPDEPTFENTIIPEDEVKGRKHYYDLLDRVTTVFFNLLSAESNDDLEALAQKMSPILTRHANDVSLNPKLFARIKYVHDHHRELTPEESMLLEKSYDGFVRSGALLDEKGKQRLRELTEEAGRLSLTFSQNLLKENKAFELNITDEAQLDGLPDSVRETAAETARERGEKGWVFTLDAPSYVPFMMYSSQRDLRKKMYMARATQGTHDNGNSNIEVCKRLINLRREMAQLLGYKTYADYVMKYRMASNVKNVYKLLDDLIENYKPTALKEQADIQALARKLEGDDFEVMPWDSSYYSHKLKLERFDLDPEMLRPYLEVSNVIKGVFGLATRLYGITFKERNDIPVYNPDVRTYEVSDTDGSYLALLYVDFHPRKGKQDGAWMTEYQGQWIERDGTNVRPHVSLVMNLSRPTADKPALLNLSEVETFLHEFGHSLHGMFANTRFESLSGTNVWWDFVEMPSQFMENYAVEKDFLHTFAFHYKTGEPMPDELIDKVVASRNFNAASACLRQVSFGLLDMAYYTLTEPFTANLMEFEKKAWAKAIITKQLPDTCMTTQFSHIMAGGYAAGYYSYKWAEVLDADVFSVFKKNGIFDRKTAQSFRDNILSRGGTEHPMVLYKRFRGQEPTIDALLERDGIKKGDDK
ncbi:dipeptidyl carboxypeptidase II [Prevotella lacticifex]|uniref:Dipeptidyl carboxypeptidase II n=2 Tax=Prevotella lacticifex TaxID=2854755 RepID=A0A9R1CUP1_9BACT|nr:dipeptidyl carboxypeptidase II [Prevotella lacticifex]GJG40836.1 dipeptidyl carboxypeptidase II [Prevotella lacticifex]GJG43693.1 dipeptidyl carboxypeptidase II [Prevotella lacticifex]GJG47474.1 dipeptidyl carboxypeptidase II [Prevotella lacticifex]GJG49874.1 dipeptidyl carboxypeptidase II [Prevotella lacticifex]